MNCVALSLPVDGSLIRTSITNDPFTNDFISVDLLAKFEINLAQSPSESYYIKDTEDTGQHYFVRFHKCCEIGIVG